MIKPLPVIGVILLFLLLFWLANRLFMPKYVTSLFEGSLTGEYYASEKQHDVLFVGDCEVYENISPVVLFDELGITSYIRGSPQQLIWQSYALLADTLRYETPKVMVFNVLAMKYGAPQSEAYNRLTIDGMALSPVKIGAALSSDTGDEGLLSYLFPLFRYHDRWKSLTAEDVRYLFQKPRVSHNGFLMRADVKPMGSLPTPPQLGDYSLDPVCFDYLDKMVSLCREKGVQPVLMKAPTLFPHWYEEWDAQLTAYALENDVDYINFIPLSEDMGIDYRTDTYDGGLHLNCAGAEKLSRYMGAWLKQRFDLPDWREDKVTREIWAEKSEAYRQMKAIQQEEIARLGKIVTLTIAQMD